MKLNFFKGANSPNLHVLFLSNFLMGILQFACNNALQQSDITINTKSAAHMITQVRIKQQATKSSQDKVKQYIVDHMPTSKEGLVKRIKERLEDYIKKCEAIEEYFKEKSFTANDLGFPIKSNKTLYQLKMAKDWVEAVDEDWIEVVHEDWVEAVPEDLIEQIKKGFFYHKLTNAINPNALPTLGSNSKREYWGNENPSVSSVLLAVVALEIGGSDFRENFIKNMSMPGAAAFYPFYREDLKLPEDLVANYPFASRDGMLLFGNFQYGGHRYLKNGPFQFYPEDGSSAVGKAIYLKPEEVKDFSTTNVTRAFDNPNEVNLINKENGYQPILCVDELKTIYDVRAKLKLIEPGDIYTTAGGSAQAAIFLTKPNEEACATLCGFNRNNIENAKKEKLEGGGIYEVNLLSKIYGPQKKLYVLRKKDNFLSESYSLPNFLNKVDAKYKKLYPGVDVANNKGDCKVFFENNG